MHHDFFIEDNNSFKLGAEVLEKLILIKNEIYMWKVFKTLNLEILFCIKISSLVVILVYEYFNFHACIALKLKICISQIVET